MALANVFQAATGQRTASSQDSQKEAPTKPHTSQSYQSHGVRLALTRHAPRFRSARFTRRKPLPACHNVYGLCCFLVPVG